MTIQTKIAIAAYEAWHFPREYAGIGADCMSLPAIEHVRFRDLPVEDRIRWLLAAEAAIKMERES